MSKNVKLKFSVTYPAISSSAGHSLMVLAVLPDGATDANVAGVIRVMQSSDGMIRFYAHGATKTPDENEQRLGRFDTMIAAGHAIAVNYAKSQKTLPVSGLFLTSKKDEAPSDVDLH